jgi:hypothetical protein
VYTELAGVYTELAGVYTELAGVYTELTGVYTELRHRILSAEKVRMLRAIYSWSCIEYSALLLCNKFPPKKKHVPFYIRFLCTDAPGMVDVR